MSEFPQVINFLDKSISFPQLKVAIIVGNIDFVKFYLAQPECPLFDPQEDTGYADEDGYTSTVIHSLLYEAVPHPELLKVLLNDGRFNPNDNNQDAFYRCLYSGSIEALMLFYEDKRFSFPQDTLIKAAQLGGTDLMEFLLKLDELENYQLFSDDTKEVAFNIANENSDSAIIEMLKEHNEHTSYASWRP